MAYDDQEDTFFADLPEEEVQAALKPPPPWAEGIYDGTIVSAERYQGEGKPYPCIKVAVNVVNSEGKARRLTTWILSKNPAAIAGGIRTLRALGLSNRDYRHPSQLVGLSAPVQIVVKDGSDGEPRNEIKNFVSRRR